MEQYKKLFIVAGFFIVLIAIMFFYMSSLTRDDYPSPNHSQASQPEFKSQRPSSSQPNSDTPIRTNKVKISNYDFTPAVIVIKVGEAVTWTNEDSVTHTIISEDDSVVGLNSGNLNKGQTYSFTFNKAGTYNYTSTSYTYMKGKIIVE